MAYNKNTGLYEGFIYKIYSNNTSKIYIGQTTVSISSRWSQHIYRSKYNQGKIPYLYKAMRKYGIDSFKIMEIKKITNISLDKLKDILNENEIYYIKKYNSLAPNGYNLTKGGNNSGEYLKISVSQYSLDGLLLNIFDSIKDAAIAIREEQKTKTLNTNGISKCCDGLYSQCAEYIWRYINDSFDKYKNKKYGNNVKVKCFDKNGNLINTFNSISNAIIEMRLPKGCSSFISSCCMGKTKSAYGYIWRYYDDDFYKYDISHNRIKPSINCYNLDNQFIGNFKNISTAIYEIFNYKSDKILKNIHSCLSDGRCNSQGYKWFYANDPSQPDKTKIIA